MEKIHFPGYSRCTACQSIIGEKEMRNHILDCRRKSSNETKLCAICNKQFNITELQEHIATCNEQQNISSTSISSSKKKCSICNKYVEDLVSHTQLCNDNDENNNTGYETPRAQTPTQIEKNVSTEIIKKPTKLCALCSQQIDELDYRHHVEFCSLDDQHLTNNSLFNENKNSSENKSSKEEKILKRKQTKLCALCSQQIDEEQFIDHLTSCSNDQTSNNNQMSYSKQNSSSSNKKETKYCGLCSQQIDELDYRHHVEFCSLDDQHLTNNTISNDKTSSKQKSKTKQIKCCPLCSEEIDESEYEDHVASCSNDNQSAMIIDDHLTNYLKILSTSTIPKKKQKKQCILCSQSFDEEEYQEHVTSCLSEQDNKKYSHQNSNKYKKKNSRKDCLICFKSIDESEYMDHVTSCLPETPPSISQSSINFHRDDYQTNSFSQSTTPKPFRKDEKSSSTASPNVNRKSTRDCIICFKPIDQSQYENHVSACVAEAENQSFNSTTRKNLKCLTCNRSINKDDDLYQEIPCHSHHNHCLSCLKRSMEDFARNLQVPVCHKSLCDYEFSRHDISSIPLERRLSDRLLKLVKGQQRPLCPKCHFYINITENENFDEHLELCGDLIPCEYCQLPFPFKQLEIHARQCRSDQTSDNEKLINFILIRTKYPFTKEQIRIFIQQQNKIRRSALDPSSIIDALAVFGPIFPYEIPTRECGICLEARPYDDIYVFDCPDSHKLCYVCYYQSCQAKLANGEILTCALCTHLLRDGELNQLRIPIEELKKIRDYQIRKTFDIYSSRTRGIIKCPNQNCSWVAEAEDPNERFRVTCPKCNSEFCSLCNQQYHYRTTCQQLPQITQRWFFWCETERTRYLRMRAEQDTAYATQLADYNRQSNENNNRNNDLRRRYDELMNDEQYKTQNCRLCPSCKRVVQRLEGCDSMICGQDAHGGNVQSGCGTKFNWAQAQPYAATATQQPKQTIFDLPKPENPVVHHDGVKCDHCQNDVNGIRFDCVHCPSLTYCEKCEQQATLMHSRENQVLEQQQHVFKLIMMPQEEATQF